MKSLNRIRVLTGRNLREILRDPLSLIFLLGMPGAMLILFWLIFHQMTAQFEMQYLAPGIVVFGQSFLSLFAGLLISLDRGTSFLTRLYVTPTKSHEFILGYLIALLPLGILQSVIFFVIAGILDPSFWSVRLLLGIPAGLLTAFFFICLGILFGSVCNEKSIGGVSSILVAGQSVLSGMWFPLDGLSSGFLTFMNALPFRNGTLWMQNVLSGNAENAWNSLWRPFTVLLCYTLAAFVLSVLCFYRKMRKQ